MFRIMVLVSWLCCSIFPWSVGKGSFANEFEGHLVGTARLSPAGYFAFTIPGGFHVPSPGGRIEGGSVFGQ
jgi:hypothetical protein